MSTFSHPIHWHNLPSYNLRHLFSLLIIYTLLPISLIRNKGGITILSPLAFNEVGGYNRLITEYFKAAPSKVLYDKNNEVCPNSLPPPYAMNFFRPIIGSDLPWPGVLFGVTIGSIWYWCTDQVSWFVRFKACQLRELLRLFLSCKLTSTILYATKIKIKINCKYADTSFSILYVYTDKVSTYLTFKWWIAILIA